MVQSDQGIRIHSALRRRWLQGCLRPHFGCRASRPELTKRGTSRRVRDREQSRKRVGGQPQDQMTVLMSEPAELTSASCRSCGACCSFSAEWPRFSLESELSLSQIPRACVDDERNRMRCNGNRRAALVGEVGIWTTCAVYAVRPDVRKACLPGDGAYQMARARFNL